MVTLCFYAVAVMLPWDMVAVSPGMLDGVQVNIASSPSIVFVLASEHLEPRSSSGYGRPSRMLDAERRVAVMGCDEALSAGSSMSGRPSVWMTQMTASEARMSQSMRNVATNSASVFQSSLASILSNRANFCPVPS